MSVSLALFWPTLVVKGPFPYFDCGFKLFLIVQLSFVFFANTYQPCFRKDFGVSGSLENIECFGANQGFKIFGLFVQKDKTQKKTTN